MTTYYVVDGRRNPMTEEAIGWINESQAPGAIACNLFQRKTFEAVKHLST